MFEEIAVYINSLGQTAKLNESGVVKVFSRNQNEWSVIRELPFKINSAGGIKAVRSDVLNIAKALDKCKVFVAREISGLTYTVLDTLGFSTWEMDGSPNEFLEYVLDKEKEEAEQIKLIKSEKSCDKKEIIAPVESNEKGCFILNLKELQESNTSVTSKQALQPFLNNGIFYELKVTCNHIPGWLERELIRLNLNFEILKASPTDYIVTISKKVCSA